MLPALLLRGLAAAQPAYTRRPRWSQPHESLWAILAKWQFINCLPYSTIAHCVAPLSGAPTYDGVDLRILDGFDLNALSHYSGVPRAALAAGACSAGADSSVLARTCVNLRFCPSCLCMGFHATLFQFTPISRCPIHNVPLLDACPACCGQTPYRLSAAFAARPLACPHCLRSLVPDPTVLMRADFSGAKSDSILKWQRLLAKYAYWYRAVGTAARTPCTAARYGIHAGNSLAFIGRLQDAMREPPQMLSMGASRAVMPPPSHRHTDAAFARAWRSPVANEHWPHFQAKTFVDLHRRYAQFHHDHQRQDSAGNRQVTHWWRRTWEGAISRPVSTDVWFEEPPFGLAEWIAFSAPCETGLSARAAHDRLTLHFEEDLQLTWDSWSGVLDQVSPISRAGLHPNLVPPRGCWLSEPEIQPDAPALGFF